MGLAGMPIDIVSQLLVPGAYPHPVAKVQLRETHISWVFLTGEFAYKVKKPRNLGFLDFSTLEARKHFCEEELRLNRRFAPSLYLGVVPLTLGDALQIEGGGEVVDYAVKMRQFDDAGLLSNLALSKGLKAKTIRELGKTLAQTHAALDPLYPPSGPGTPLVIQDAMLQNFCQISRYPLAATTCERLTELQRWSTERIAQLMPAMVRRVALGNIKDCHGDLHLGNIAVIDEQLVFFDCIEFNEEFRVMDTIAELAFVAMDCEARGLVAQARQLVNDYLEYSGDYSGLALLSWYGCYYALVRAKVNLMQVDPAEPELLQSDAYRDFLKYLDLALRFSSPAKPFLAITCGVSGSGKSTVAKAVFEATGAIRLRSDVERKRLFNLAPESTSESAVDRGIYTAEASAATFARLYQLALLTLNAGFSCIVDATFLRRKQRKPYRRMARDLGVPFVILSCEAAPNTMAKRIEKRNRKQSDASEANVEVMQRQLKSYQPPSGSELDVVLLVDSDTALKQVIKRLPEVGQMAPKGR
jgi:aminoglycoside phosphotransferase family enzyme/predicted kinase